MMKYWKERKTDVGDGLPRICLKDIGDSSNLIPRILSIKKQAYPKIRFREECDGYFCTEMTKEEAVEALQEAIDWLNGGMNDE